MLTIRLTRVGKRGQPVYRLIVSEKARDPWGKALELLGTYNPLVEPAKLELNKERITYWISKGAQCSDTVRNLLITEGLLKGDKKKLNSLSKRRTEKLAKEKAEAK